MVFLPKDAVLRKEFEARLEAIGKGSLLGWRTVPTDNRSLGATAKAGEPYVRQIFIGRNNEAWLVATKMAFERKLYVIRKRAEQSIRFSSHPQAAQFYIASLSSHHCLQGHAAGRPSRRLLPGLTRSIGGIGDSRRALAL